MSTEHKLIDEHDVGLMLWIDEATRGLGSEESQRIREETTEHFLAALDEIRREGASKGAARVAALERLGDSDGANVEFLTAHFASASHRTIGTPTSRRWTGLAVTLALIPLVLMMHGAGAPPVPTAAYVGIGLVIAAAWLGTFAARHSFAWWFWINAVGGLAGAGLFLTIPHMVGRLTVVIILSMQIWNIVKMSRRMTVPNR